MSISFSAKTVLLNGVVASAFVLAPAASARLGESPEQCSARYEKLIKKIPYTVPNSDAEAMMFEKTGYTIVVNFKDGKAWHISYSKDDLGVNDTPTFLKANSTGDEWLPPDGHDFQERRYWLAKNSKHSATYIRVRGLGIMEVMTEKCRKALGDARMMKIRQALRSTLKLNLGPAPKTSQPGKGKVESDSVDLKGF